MHLRGRIRLDGIDHSHLSANELRSIFGIVPQGGRGMLAAAQKRAILAMTRGL
jgi:hypothetical protein